MSATEAFLTARDFLLQHREDYPAACQGFRWPDTPGFNWGLDYFDRIARGNTDPALCIVDADTELRVSFAELARRSSQVANFLRQRGVGRGDRLLVMLPNVVALWELTLACLKLGAVLSPATTLLSQADLVDRIQRGGVGCVVADHAGRDKFADLPPGLTRILVDGSDAGWHAYEESHASPESFVPDAPTRADDPFLLYFTSGTTARPKMVLHTQRSYPVGHLSTMYWLGLRPGDMHWNISSPGWAKHAWSNVFAPWNAQATVFIYNQPRFDGARTLAALGKYQITSLCAPPTVWRLLILEDLASYPVHLREVASAGEPLNPEVIDRVRLAWGLDLRDGYGQTETTALVGNSPGQKIKPGSMGRPMPGYVIDLRDADNRPAEEGEIVVATAPRPAGLMAGYVGAVDAEEHPPTAGYRTCDVARRDEEGYLWYVGRADDVFKSSDYRLSPFEIESALLEHQAVAEAAVVPSPDPIRLCVPKAFIVLKPGLPPTRQTAADIFAFCKQRLAPYQRVRRIEFGDLPKTISGKIRRVELRSRETEAERDRRPGEFWEADV